MIGRRSNAAKSEEIERLFKGLVKRGRTPTGKSKGKKKFWLSSNIRRIAPSVNQEHPRYLHEMKDSLWERFRRLLNFLYEHGIFHFFFVKNNIICRIDEYPGMSLF